ncbi:MAG: hypothetical protein ACOYMA_19180, partial [Bacteroidia bacterium]
MLGNGKKNIGFTSSFYTNKSDAAPVVYDADAVLYFNRIIAAGGTLSTIQKNAVNTMVLTFKTTDAWSKTLAFYPFLGLSAATCAINLKSTSYNGVFYGGWLFQDAGVKPNGTNAYYDTGIEGYPDLINERLLSMSTYINEYSETPRAQMGAIAANSSFDLIAPLLDSATSGRYSIARTNGVGLPIINQATPLKGFLAVNRNSLANFQYYKDDTIDYIKQIRPSRP